MSFVRLFMLFSRESQHHLYNKAFKDRLILTLITCNVNQFRLRFIQQRLINKKQSKLL